MTEMSLLVTANEQFLPSSSFASDLPLIEDDELLEVLANAANSELESIVEYLTKQGGVTCQLKRTKLYKANYPNHRAYSRDIAADLQKFGGNTLANQLMRSGRGVLYAEIVNDVARYLKVSPRSSVRESELAIREHLLAELWKRMSPDERNALLKEYKVRDRSLIANAALPAVIIKATSLTGFGAYKASVILANAFAKAAVGHGLSFLTNSILTKTLSVFLGPVGWALAATYAAQVMGGEAYRVTVPCVLQISMIREANSLREIKPVSQAKGSFWIAACIIMGLLLAIAAVACLGWPSLSIRR